MPALPNPLCNQEIRMFSLAFGVGTHNNSCQWLEVFYPSPLLNPAPALVSAICQTLKVDKVTQAITLQSTELNELAKALQGVDAEQAAVCQQLAGSTKPRVLALVATDEKPSSVPEVY